MEDTGPADKRGAEGKLDFSPCRPVSFAACVISYSFFTHNRLSRTYKHVSTPQTHAHPLINKNLITNTQTKTKKCTHAEGIPGHPFYTNTFAD